MVRSGVLLLAVLACSCVTLTSDGARVKVFRGSLEAEPAQRSMPEGCRLLSSTPPTTTTELDLEGQKDPFRAQRNETGAAGGNALLVLTQMTLSRRESDCPVASPITDCPPSFGAWYRMVIESYACTPEAFQALASAPASPRAQSPGIVLQP